VVLGRRADHRRAADVDVLDAMGEVGTLGHGGFEGIEIDDEQVDRRDAVRLCGALMLGIAADRQQPTMHHGMQSLEAAIHHLRKAGVLRDVLDAEAGLFQRAGRASGRQKLDAGGGQPTRELDQARLVGHGDERALDGGGSCRHVMSLPNPRPISTESGGREIR
jgi:hypothetical protein